MNSRFLITVFVGLTPVLVADGELIRSSEILTSLKKSVALLQRTQTEWIKTQTCASCHHSSLPTMALVAAREHGVPIDEEAARRHFGIAFAPLTDLDQTVQGSSVFDPLAQSYQLLAVRAGGIRKNIALAAFVRFFASHQRPDGQWRTQDVRPPQTGSSFSTTALTLRAMDLYMPDELAGEKAERMARARQWLIRNAPRTTEDRVFQLLGLGWAGASREERTRVAQAILAEQLPDGGWAQLPGRRPDAYATGESLAALHEAGALATVHPAYQRGLRFLLQSQVADGSWLVLSRFHDDAPVSPPYFETGFPHGRNQIASTSGTSWAVMALSYALPEKLVEPLVAGTLAGPEPPKWLRTALFGTGAQLRTQLDYGLDPNSTTPLGTTLLMAAAGDPEKGKLLLGRGADVNAKAKSGYTPLLVAVTYGNSLESVRQMIGRGAQVNLKGASPLIHAVISGDLPTARLLLAHGADPNQANLFFGLYLAKPLQIATNFDDESMIRELARAGADLRVVDSDGVNLAGLAALNDAAGAVKALAGLGVDVNHVDHRGMTPLLWASTVEFGTGKVAEALLAAGADSRIKGKNGVTARSQAEKYNNRAVLSAVH